MITKLTPGLLTASVLAVPPLARKPDLSLNVHENESLIRHIESGGVTTLLYIKHDGYIEPHDVKRLADGRLISGIKYATVRADPANDQYLRRLLDVVDRRMVISGIGEQPAIVHLRDFGLGGFTSGCVCVAP